MSWFSIHLTCCGLGDLTRFQWAQYPPVEHELVAPDLVAPWELALIDLCQDFWEPFHHDSPHLFVRELCHVLPPKLLMGFSEEWNFLSPTMTVLSFLTPLLRYSLHDLDGLIFIRAHNINSSILLCSNNKLLHQQFAILPSLSALRPVLGLEMRIDICGKASRKREKETPKDWAKIRNVLWETENEQTDEAGSCFVVVPRWIQPLV